MTAEPATSRAIRVLLADDQHLVRTGFRVILEVEDDIHVVGEAADGERAVSMARALRPDVVLMDVEMPRVDGWRPPDGSSRTWTDRTVRRC